MAERIVSGADRDYKQSYTGADWGVVEDKYDPKGNFTPKPGDYHPRFEYVKVPQATGVEVQTSKTTVYLEATVAEKLPFVHVSPTTNASIGTESSIGLGGKRERTITFEGPDALQLAHQFQIPKGGITVKTEAPQLTSIKSRSTAA